MCAHMCQKSHSIQGKESQTPRVLWPTSLAETVSFVTGLQARNKHSKETLTLLSWATKTIDRLHTKSIEFSQASSWEKKLLKPWMQAEEERAS